MGQNLSITTGLDVPSVHSLTVGVGTTLDLAVGAGKK